MTARKLKILTIEDNPGDALLIESYLEESYFYSYKTEIAETLEAGLEKLHEQVFDIVTLDLGLPDAVGMEGVERILQEQSQLCLIVVTGNENKALGVDAIKLGAQDYLNKNTLAPDNLDKSLAFAYDRLKAQQQLAHQQHAYELALAQYHLLAENSMDLIMVADIDFSINYISPTVESIMGYTVEEYAQKRLKDVIVEEDLPAAKEIINDFRAGAKAAQLELRFRTNLPSKILWFDAKVERKIGLEADKDVFVIRLRDIQKRKEAELSLLESQQRLDMAIKGTNAGTWDWRIKDGFTLFNDRWAEIIGYTLEELKPVSIKTWEKFSHPEDLKMSAAKLEAHFRGETEFYACRVRMQHKQGHWVWVWDRGRVVERDEKGEPLRMIGTHVDITEQMEAELRLIESEEKYKSLAESFPHVLWKANAEGQIIYVNKNGLDQFGVSFEKLEKDSWLSIIHPDDQKRVIDQWLISIKNKGKHFDEQRMLVKDGSYHWFRVEAYPQINDDKSLEWIGTSTDINEAKLAQKSLIESEKKYRFLAENLPLMLMKLNSNFELTYMNHVGLEYAGHKSIPRDSEVWAKHIHPDDAKKVPDYLSKCLTQNTSVTYDQRIKNKEGEYRWFSVTVYPYHDPTGEDVSLLAIAREVHDEKIAQEALLQSEADFRRGFEVAKIGRWKYNIQEDQFVWTDDARKVMRIPKLEKIDTINQFMKHWHPESREEVAATFQNSWQKGHFYIEHRYLHENGDFTWVRVIADVLNDEKGKPEILAGVVQNITEEKERERVILENERRFKNVINAFKDVIFTLDLDLKHTAVYGDWVEESGLTDAFFLGKTPIEIMGPEVGELHEKEMRYALKHNNHLYRWNTVSPHGALVHYQTRLSHLLNENDEVIGLLGVGRDITEEVSLLNEIKISEARFSDLVLHSPVILYEYEINKGGHYYSESVKNILGYTSDELIADPQLWSDSIHPDDKVKVFGAVNDYLQQGKFSVEYRIKHKTGDYLWFRDAAIQRADQNPNVIRGVAIDITEEKKLFERVSEAGQRYKNTLENITEGYMIFNTSGEILDINKSGLELLGLQSIEEQHTILEFLEDTDQYTAIHNSLIEEGQLLNQNIEIKNASGDSAIFKFNFKKSIISDDDKLYEASFHDISEDFYLNRLAQSSAELYQFKENNSLNDLIQFGVDISQKLSNSQIAFFHLVNDDQDTIRLTQWSNSTKEICEVPELLTHYPISEAGVWVDCVKTKTPIVHNDYQSLSKKGGLPEGHVFLRRDLEVPILENDKVVAIIGVGNKSYNYTNLDEDILQAFGATFWSVIKGKESQEKILEQKHYIEESEKQYATLVNNVNGTVYKARLDDSFHALFVSDGCLPLTGYTPDEFKENPSLIMDIVHPNDQEEVMQTTLEAVKHKSEFKMSFRIYDKGEILNGFRIEAKLFLIIR